MKKSSYSFRKSKDYCSESKKVKHASKKDAKSHLKRIINELNKEYFGHVYRCPDCNCWHVGRKDNYLSNRLLK